MKIPRLYIVAAQSEAQLIPTFQKVPAGLDIGALEVLNADDVPDMDGDQCKAILLGVIACLDDQLAKRCPPEPEPYRRKQENLLPMIEEAGAGDPDPDAWRREFE
jgi:hypothetical protein